MVPDWSFCNFGRDGSCLSSAGVGLLRRNQWFCSLSCPDFRLSDAHHRQVTSTSSKFLMIIGVSAFPFHVLPPTVWCRLGWHTTRYKSIYWQPRRLDCHIHNTQNNTGIRSCRGLCRFQSSVNHSPDIWKELRSKPDAIVVCIFRFVPLDRHHLINVDVYIFRAIAKGNQSK